MNGVPGCEFDAVRGEVQNLPLSMLHTPGKSFPAEVERVVRERQKPINRASRGHKFSSVASKRYEHHKEKSRLDQLFNVEEIACHPDCYNSGRTFFFRSESKTRIAGRTKGAVRSLTLSLL